MQVRIIDPRDQVVAATAPRYRVVFRGGEDRFEEWELSDADLDEVLLWIPLHASGRTHSLWAVIPDGSADGVTAVRLRGVDAEASGGREPSWAHSCGPISTAAGRIESVVPTRTADRLHVTVAFEIDEEFRRELDQYHEKMQQRVFGRQPIESRADPLDVAVLTSAGERRDAVYRLQGGSGAENYATWVFEGLPTGELELGVRIGEETLYRANVPG